MFKKIFITILIAVTLLPLAGGLALASGPSYNDTDNKPLTASSPTIANPTLTGNVGINSTAPGQSLDVNGTVRATSFIGDGNVGIGTWLPSEAFEVGARRFQVQADGDIILANGSILTNTSGVRLDFSPNSSSSAGQTFFRLASGTTSSASAGQSTIVAINPVISQSGTAGYTGLSLNVTESSIGSGPRELINVQNGSTRMMVLKSDGNLGISTFQPNALLDVSSTVAQDLFRVNDNGTGDATPFIINSLGNVGIGTFNPFGGQLIIPTTNGNVGIGSLTPGTALDVTGTVRATSFSGDGSGLTGLNNGFTDSGTTVYTTTATDNVGIGTIAYAGTKLAVMGGNVGIGTNTPQGGLVVTNGNVGIGTWAPISPLDIRSDLGSVRVTATVNSRYLETDISAGSLDLFNAGFNINRLSTTDVTLARGGGNVGVGTGMTGSKGKLIVIGGNVGIGTITPQGGLVVMNGNVGIGTWAPTTALEVNGTISSSSSGDSYFIGNLGIGSTVPGYSLDVIGVGRFSSGINSAKITNLTSNGFVKTSSGDGTLSVDTGAYPTESISTGYISKAASNSAIDDSAIFQLGSNIGIGSLAPGQVLDVTGTVRATSFIGDGSGLTSVPSNAGFTDSGTEVYSTTATDNVGIGTIAYTGTKLAIMGGNVGIGTNTPQGGFVVTNGNVGIGTWAPASMLHVAKGDILLDNTKVLKGSNAIAPGNIATIALVDSSSYIGFAPSYTNSNGWYLGDSAASRISGSGANANATMSFINNSITTMTMNSSGNVGILTTTPQASLVIASGSLGVGTFAPRGAMEVRGGNVRVGDGTVDQATGEGDLYVAGKLEVDGSVWLGDAAADNLTVTGTFTQAGDFNVSGNFGVGTTNPQTKLAVLGPVGIGTWSTGPNVGLAVLNGNVGVATNAPSAMMQVVQSSAADAFRVDDAASDTTPFVITSTGNVGIGTADPQELFVVGGQKLRVDSNGRMKLAANQGTTTNAQIDFANSTTFSSATTVYGLTGEVANSSSGNVYGLSISPSSSFAGTVSEVRGVTASVRTHNAGLTLTSGYDFYAATPTITSGAITTQYGLYIAQQASAGVTKGYGIYQADLGDVNFFAGNIGVGTTTPQGALTVTRGNVGIGTWTAAGGNLIVNGGGNVGIGSAWPGTTLDVTGDIRASGTISAASISGTITPSSLEVTGQTILNTSSGNTGIGTTLTGGNTARLAVIGGNVGIGTTRPVGGFVVTNGNVGIGTWVPLQKLQVIAGNIGIETSSANTTPSRWIGSSIQQSLSFDATSGTVLNSLGSMLFSIDSNANDTTRRFIFQRDQDRFFSTDIEAGTALMVIEESGNVGIATFAPNALLDISSTAAQDLFRLNDNGTGDATPFIITSVGNVGIGTSTAASSLDLAGSFGVSTVSKSANYTATGSDHVILVDSTGGVTITLPAAASSKGRMYVIKKTDATAGALTIDADSSETIDGALTFIITTQYQSITIVCDGSNWYII